MDVDPRYRGGCDIGKRYLVRLNPLTSTVVWEATEFGDNSATSNGAWEMIDIYGDNIILSGVRQISSLEGTMDFKSYGNVGGGTAVVMQIPVSSLTSAPSSLSASWTKEYNSPAQTAKAARPIGNTGNIAVLLWGEETAQSSAMLDKLSALNGQSLLAGGIKQYGATHGEGTDIAVSTDGSSVYITGHGKSPLIPNGSELYGKITKIRASDYVQQWSKGYASCNVSTMPTCWPIKNECWGIASLTSGNVVIGCGTGIEDCNDPMPQSQKTQCLAGNQIDGVDPRINAIPYRSGIWRSMTVEVDSNGDVVWQRVDAYKGQDDTDLNEHGSSACEYVFVKSNNNLAFVQDEIFGVGVFEVSGSSSSNPSTEAPGTTAGSDTTSTPATPSTPETTEVPGDDDSKDNNTIMYAAIGASATFAVLILLGLCWITMRSKR